MAGLAAALAAALGKRKKPGILLAPHWKPLLTLLPEKQLLLEISQYLQLPLAVARGSKNIYFVPPGEKLLARFAANLMFHGELGFHSIVPGSVLQDQDISLIDQLSRRVHVLYETEQIILGATQGNLLSHATHRSKLLDLPCETLQDHAWLACAFSYGKLGFSTGAAAQNYNGGVFRAGEIEGFLTSQEAVAVGLEANGLTQTKNLKWSFCAKPEFQSHPWYSARFVPVEIV